eukprot:gene38705-47804_t
MHWRYARAGFGQMHPCLFEMIPKKLLAIAAAAVITCLSFTQAAQAGPRLDKIMETKTIRVGTPGDYRPFAIKTDAGFSGHDIDVIETMAKELGVKIEYVQTSWPNLTKDLQADKFDVAVGGITRNVTRMRLFDMLPGYAPFGKVALVRSADKAKYTSRPPMAGVNSGRIFGPPLMAGSSSIWASSGDSICMPKNTPNHTSARANTGQLARYTSFQLAANCSRRPRQRVAPRRKRMALAQMATARSCPVKSDNCEAS